MKVGPFAKAFATLDRWRSMYPDEPLALPRPAALAADTAARAIRDRALEIGIEVRLVESDEFAAWREANEDKFRAVLDPADA